MHQNDFVSDKGLEFFSGYRRAAAYLPGCGLEKYPRTPTVFQVVKNADVFSSRNILKNRLAVYFHRNRQPECGQRVKAQLYGVLHRRQ